MARAEDALQRTGLRSRVLGIARRLVLRRVGSGKPAAKVVRLEVAETGKRPQRSLKRREIENLRADVEVESSELK